MLILLGLAGLWLFLQGMTLMKSGLENAAAHKMKTILEKMTRTPLKACISGIFITMFVQGSTAVSVLSVGFVNAGIMNLKRAIGILLGANIGTCATVQVLSFNLTWLAIAAGICGIVLSLAGRDKNYVYNTGRALTGFGLIFSGLKLMNISLLPLQQNDMFLCFLSSLTGNNLAAVFAGTIASALLHSSAAATGIVMLLSEKNLLSLDTAIAVVLGNNIGTCFTAVLASLSGSAAGKKVALAHVLLNVLGVIVFFPILPAFALFAGATAGELPRQVANAHTLFNIASTIIVLPFTGALAGLVERLVPSGKNGNFYLLNFFRRR